MSHASPNSQSAAGSGRRWKLVAGVGFVAILGVGLALTTGNAASTSQARAEQRSRHSFARYGVAMAGQDGQLCSFEPGTRMAYEVHGQTEFEVDMSEVSKGMSSSQMPLSASPAQQRVVDRHWQLELVALERGDDGSNVLAARIEDRGTKVSGDIETAPNSPHLSDTFLIRVDADCGLREFGWRSEGDLAAAYEQQVMAVGLGFSAPANTSEPTSYARVNFDTVGRYRANYHYEDGRIEGTATSHAVGRDPKQTSRTTAQVLASNIEVELAPGVWFESLLNERDLELSMFGRSFGTHFHSTRAVRVEPGSFTPSVDLRDGGWSWGRVGAPRRDPSQDFDEALVGKPITDVIARQRELIAAGNSADATKLLTGWLRANPEQTGGLVAMLEAGELDGRARATSFAALGRANTDEAKSALTDILQWPKNSDQIAAAFSIAEVHDPSAEMIDLVVAATEDEELHPIERNSMALALGMVAGGAGRDSEAGVEARGQIHRWLESPESEAQLENGLLAAGNAGGDDLAAVIGSHVDDDSPKVRKQATKALRQMSPDEANPYFERALGDSDPSVRAIALETAGTVALKHDRAPSEALVERAAESLTSAQPQEQRAAVALLGAATKHGDERANELLQAHLQELLAAKDADPKLLAAVGQSMPAHWRRNN